MIKVDLHLPEGRAFLEVMWVKTFCLQVFQIIKIVNLDALNL